MRRFEYKDETSNKFWSIELEGDSIHLAWGRIGSKGQSKTRTFDDEEKARKEHEKLIKSKTKKGYVEVTEGSAESDLRTRMNAISDLDNDLEEFHLISEDLGDDTSLLVDVIAMLERVAGQDDFGVFHSFGGWLEQLDPQAEIAGKTPGEHMLESVTRAVNWKILELLPYFVEDESRIVEALRTRAQDPDITSSEFESVRYELEALGVVLDEPAEEETPEPAAQEASSDAAEADEPAWWEVEVKEGVARIWQDVSDEDIRFLIDHPEHVKDAVYSLQISGLENPGRLRELDRLLISQSTFYDHELTAFIDELRDRLYGIEHSAAYDGEIQSNLSIISNLPELRIFDIGLSGVDGDAFGDLLRTLPKLEHLRIGERSQFAALEAIQSPHLLRRIDASEVWGARHDEPALGQEEVKHLARFENLESITLSSNHLAPDALAPLSALKNLKSLTIVGAKWPKPDWSFLEGTSVLEDFSIWQSGTIPASSARLLSRVRNLRRFETRDASVGAAGVEALSELPALECLSIASVADDDLAKLRALTGLKQLSLRSAKITDEGVSVLSKFGSLEELEITKAPLTDAAISKLPESLQILTLSKISLTKESIKHFKALKNIRNLTVSGVPKHISDELSTWMKEQNGHFSDYHS